MNDDARLAERVRVHVLHAPGEVGRRPVVLAVDDVTDAPDSKTYHGRRPAGVDDLPEREFRAARPDVCAQDRPEQSAPLADAAFGDVEDVNQPTREELEVLPDI